jgi:hypothetical protein
MKRIAMILALTLIAFNISAEVLTKTPLIQVFGQIYAVYDVHVFQDAYDKYRALGMPEQKAADMAQGVTWNDIEMRHDAAQRAIRNANPEFYDAMMRHYGFEFAGK